MELIVKLMKRNAVRCKRAGPPAITHNKDNAAGATHKPNSMNSIQSVCLFIRLLLSVAAEEIIKRYFNSTV